MKKAFLYGSLFLLLMSGMAHATMTTIGTATYNGSEYNLIWDDDNNGNSVVWLDYTNEWALWDNQVTWASNLNVPGVLTYNIDAQYSVTWDSGWRLPVTVDGLYVMGYDGTTTAGYNITTSEMGHLYFEELGNLAYYDTSGSGQSGWGLTETGDFENLIQHQYWSGTEYSNDTDYAWCFVMNFGDTNTLTKTNYCYGLAVRSGQITVVPVPGTVWLFGLGLTGLTAIGRRIKIKQR